MVVNISSKYKKEVIELLVAIAILLLFLVPAMDLEGPLGQFPRLFLIAGLIFLGIEVVIRFLPQRYRQIALNFTSGLTNEMTEEVEEDIKEKTSPSEPDESGSAATGDGTILVDSDAGHLSLFLGILAAFYVVSYLIGFLWGIPLLTAAIIYAFGSWDWKVWLVATAILVALIYGLFGEVMNIPITEGVLQ